MRHALCAASPRASKTIINEGWRIVAYTLLLSHENTVGRTRASVGRSCRASRHVIQHRTGRDYRILEERRSLAPADSLHRSGHVPSRTRRRRVDQGFLGHCAQLLPAVIRVANDLLDIRARIRLAHRPARGRGQCRRRAIHEQERLRLRLLRHTPHRASARPAGHALRTQHQRGRDEHIHPVTHGMAGCEAVCRILVGRVVCAQSGMVRPQGR